MIDVLSPYTAVLFDLDGTLVDTAPDMAGALNELRGRHALAALPYDELRPLVSHGSRALVQHGFDTRDEDRTLELVGQCLDGYAERVAQESTLFPGLHALLDALERADIVWGVVTNKPGRLSEALLEGLGLRRRTRTLVCGDTLTERKPHPMPLLHAAANIDVAAAECLYVGDAERDIVAGRAAGMRTIAAAYGYILPDDRVDDWRADYVVDDVSQLHRLLLGDPDLAT